MACLSVAKDWVFDACALVYYGAYCIAHADSLPAKCRYHRRPPSFGKKEPNGILGIFTRVSCFVRQKAWVAALGMFYLYNQAVVRTFSGLTIATSHAFGGAGSYSFPYNHSGSKRLFMQT